MALAVLIFSEGFGNIDEAALFCENFTIEVNHSISRDIYFRNYFMKLEKGLDLTPLFCSSNQTPTFSNDKDQ